MLKALRKFGLEYHDLSTMLCNVGSLLRLLALNIDGRHKKRIPFIFYVFTLLSIGCYMHAFQVSMVWFIFWRGDTVVEKIIVLSLGISSLIGVTKFIYIYFNRNALKEIINTYLFCDSKVVPYSRMSRSIDASLRDVKKRAVVFWSTIVGNALIYLLIPFFIPGRHLTDDNQIIMGLEPMFESPNFEIARAMIILSVPIAAIAPINITVFFIVVVGYTEAQMVALSQELLCLWEDAQIDYRQRALELDYILNIDTYHGVLVNIYVKRRLETILKTHALNKRCIQQVEGLFKTAIAIEFTLLSTALIADLLGGLENTYLHIPFAMVQVSMDCVTGQRLLDANAAFEVAVYNCKWENFDVSNKKLVMVMLQSAQKTMKLTAGGVTSLSYMSLMSMIRSIYSAYTALRSTMSTLSEG